MKIAKLTITLDKSVQDNELFKKIESIEVEKQSIFKYGILNEDAPTFIGENDFEYLQSKVPNWAEFYGDYISIEINRIICWSRGENLKKISELIGVGVGLFYFIYLFKINPNSIRKIPKPTKSQKYMDFKAISNNCLYEIETKGTVIHSNSKKNSLLKDIKEKKASSHQTNCSLGVITMANKEDDYSDTKVIVCDDFEHKKLKYKHTILDYIKYYSFFLSFVLDSTYYNRLMAQIETGIINENMINIEKIKGRYTFSDTIYCGEYFDRRLIMKKIAKKYRKNITIDQLFNSLTESEGKQKYFWGIDINVINSFNKLDVHALSTFEFEKIVIEKKNMNLIRDTDGIIIVSSSEKGDKQINKNFPDKEVRARLIQMVNFHIGVPHKCGAPCRSKDKEGEPCEILTYRDHCHFHR